MSNNLINKSLVLAAVVRTFFKYFVTGVIEAQQGGADDPLSRFEPANVKRTMLNHYEDVSRFFNKEAFFAIARMNFEQDEIEHAVRSFITNDTTDMQLVRFACRTEEFHQAMVGEYKRNFERILCGHISAQDDANSQPVRRKPLGQISRDLAEKIIADIAANAYSCGKSCAEGA